MAGVRNVTSVSNEKDFKSWFKTAKVGDDIIYHDGSEGGYLLKGLAKHMALLGRLFLFQKRNPVKNTFSYHGRLLSEEAGKVFKPSENTYE